LKHSVTVKNVASPFDPATSISYKMGIFQLSDDLFAYI